MAYNISQLKVDLTGVLHGTTINQIQAVNNLIYRAAREVLLDADPQETKRTLQFTNPIFNSVYDYPIAPDVKGNALVDIFPQVMRLPSDIWSQAYNQAFDVTKSNIFTLKNMFTMNFNTGIKTVRINAPLLNPPIIINNADNTNDNGTWTTGGTASNLTVNNTNFVQGGGSLQFNVTTGAGWVENSTMSAVNLQANLNQASQFVNTYVPTGANLTSVELRWGSSSSNYYTVTVTQTQELTAFQNGWNLDQFIWQGATVVGAPDVTKINYVRVTLNVTANMTACKVNGVNSTLGTILNYEYYSKYMFRDAITGAFQETVTDDSNLINLDTESYNLLFYKVAELAVQQQQGLDATFYDGSKFDQKYAATLAGYKALYKSERQKPQSVYYQKPNVSNSKYIGRNYNY